MKLNEVGSNTVGTSFDITYLARDNGEEEEYEEKEGSDHGEEGEDSNISDDEVETEDQWNLKRSARTITRPSDLDDYVLKTEVIETERLLLLINEESWD